MLKDDSDNDNKKNLMMSDIIGADLGRKAVTAMVGVGLMASSLFGGPVDSSFAADTAKYDGFAEYAKENKMEQSDVGCFVTKCGEQTKNLFSNPRGIKGISCLGRCKGEQTCSVRCFAEFGSSSLNEFLSCAIEENDCVKVPRDIDSSADDIGYTSTVKSFDPKTLEGKWYKTTGLNPNYDLFPCQYNNFKLQPGTKDQLDMDIYLRVERPEEVGGGFWENNIYENMVVDAAGASTDANMGQEEATRTMHTVGKMNGLQFLENWFILGESDGSGGIPEFKLVAYRGHTLQGGYEGSFVYSRTPELPEAAIPAIRKAAQAAGLDFDQYKKIDNTCPPETPLNDVDAGTGTSTEDWINLVTGEGGVIDWISPGWRGEYNK